MSRDSKPRQKPQKPRSGSRGSTLVGVFVGLVLGAIIAAALALYLTRSSPFQKTDKEEAVPAAAAKPAPAAPPRPANDPIALPGKPVDKPVEKPRFDFYNVLPKGADALPGPDSDTEKPTAAKADKSRPGADGADKAAAPAGAKDRFYLQAGAFENPAEADNLKARLALMGVEASVQKAEVPDKGTVHRVRVGPYATQEDMNAARAQLAAGGVNAAAIRIKPKEPARPAPAPAQ
ncbi:MAG: SPOR domain-containing protein [Zoogloea sp.]|nr:SPOR domain-containing protein [Zoogloea sp.]